MQFKEQMMKNQIRKEFLQKRDRLVDREKLSQKICTAVIDSELFNNAQCVFVYLSFKSEVDTQMIIEKCFLLGKTVCVPSVKQDGDMDAVRVENINNLVYNKFGIKEPADTTKIIDKNYIDLCIVPGSAFDGQLNRIGYGKGFYDRFLQRTEIKKVALAFSCQITDSLPVEAYDVKMDAVVTEDKIYGDL